MIIYCPEISVFQPESEGFKQPVAKQAVGFLSPPHSLALHAAWCLLRADILL